MPLQSLSARTVREVWSVAKGRGASPSALLAERARRMMQGPPRLQRSTCAPAAVVRCASQRSQQPSDARRGDGGGEAIDTPGRSADTVHVFGIALLACLSCEALREEGVDLDIGFISRLNTFLPLSGTSAFHETFSSRSKVTV